MRKTDEYVIEYACNACVKVSNVKSVKRCSPEEGAGGGGGGGGRSQVPKRTPVCTGTYL